MCDKQNLVELILYLKEEREFSERESESESDDEEDENTLAKHKTTIEKEIPYVDIKPYSHNIISLTLQMIAKEFGQEVANEAIAELGLDELGWKQH